MVFHPRRSCAVGCENLLLLAGFLTAGGRLLTAAFGLWTAGLLTAGLLAAGL